MSLTIVDDWLKYGNVCELVDQSIKSLLIRFPEIFAFFCANSKSFVKIVSHIIDIMSPSIVDTLLSNISKCKRRKYQFLSTGKMGDISELQLPIPKSFIAIGELYIICVTIGERSSFKKIVRCFYLQNKFGRIWIDKCKKLMNRN
jgi:hypothetical protein